VIKKLCIALVLVVVAMLLGLFAYRLATPEIEIKNSGTAAIAEVVITLPSNRVVFGPIEPGASSTIYYQIDQAEGTYQYVVRFENEVSLSGSCGYVTSAEYGKRLRLIVHGPQSAECVEIDKIY